MASFRSDLGNTGVKGIAGPTGVSGPTGKALSPKEREAIMGILEHARQEPEYIYHVIWFPFGYRLEVLKSKFHILLRTDQAKYRWKRV